MRLALPARPYYAGILQQHERGGNEVSREYGQQRAQINLHFADDERGEHEDGSRGRARSAGAAQPIIDGA